MTWRGYCGVCGFNMKADSVAFLDDALKAHMRAVHLCEAGLILDEGDYERKAKRGEAPSKKKPKKT